MSTLELEQTAQILARSRATAALTGAGVSAESGVPTFRGAGGLWQRFRAEELATSQAFERDPALVWRFYNYRRNLLGGVEPNPAHRALAELESSRECFTVITQNVDGLHQRAGSRRVLEVHGNIWFVRCMECSRRFDKTGTALGELPHCDECGGLLRPAVVWFGETLPADVWSMAESAVLGCDCLLVVGTSGQVQPAAGLALMAKHAGARVIEINLEPTPARAAAEIALYGPAGTILPELVARMTALEHGQPSAPAG